MEEEGLGYEVPDANSVSLPPTVYEPAWWARPSTTRAARGFGYAHAFSGSDEAYRGPYDNSLAVWEVGFLRCLPVVARSPEVTTRRATALALMGSFYDSLSASAESNSFASLTQEYSGCMHEAGYPVTDPGELYDIAERAGSTKTEVGIAEADVACRAPPDQIAAALDPVVTSWLAANRQRVGAAPATWRSYGE